MSEQSLDAESFLVATLGRSNSAQYSVFVTSIGECDNFRRRNDTLPLAQNGTLSLRGDPCRTTN
jgi:hypothetical protein